MSEKETADKKFAVQQTLTLFLPDYKISFTPRSIMLNGEQGMITIDENNFEALQTVVEQICCIRNGPTEAGGFNPANRKAQEIADKIMRGRQIVAAQRGEANSSILSRYISILTVGLNSMGLEDVLNLTLYQLYDLVERYMLYTNWDMDARARLAGAKPDESPENWMKNIH